VEDLMSFSRCKIAISNGPTTVEIVLLQIAGSAQREAVTFWGQYTSNGGNIPPERRGWIYALAPRELRLVDTGGPGVGMIGGGLEYHEIAAMDPFAIFSDAVLTDRGIEPVTRNHVAVGDLKSGFALDVQLNKGPVTWRLSGYKSTGSSAWVAP
jgi:hypothetical protein